jgi:hypothetical protein
VKDKWWYSDKFGQVGPFTLEQLRDALSTFDEGRTSEVLVWCQGFSEWKAPDILNDFREQDDVLPSQKSGASWLLAQATAAIIGAGRSYWGRLANEFLRDKRDRMRTKALRARPTLQDPLQQLEKARYRRVGWWVVCATLAVIAFSLYANAKKECIVAFDRHGNHKYLCRDRE